MSIAPPVTRDVWSYAGEFHVEATGHNRHRRATLPELKSHFETSENRPAHWYEAQLLHYGLPPSKTKGTAKMRLFESVTKGHLAVPGHIAKIEADLKKEWIKREREAKQALKKQSEPAAPSKPSRKRKADDGRQPGTNFNISLNLAVGAGGNVSFTSASSEPVAKKTKTVKAEPAAKKAKPPAKAKASTSKATATKTTTTKASRSKPRSTSYSWKSEGVSSPVLGSAPASASRQIQRARRGGPKAIASRQPPTSPPQPTAGRQTARRSRPFHPTGLANTPRVTNNAAPQPAPDFDDEFDDPPPPYPGSQDSEAYALPPLGLLNGRYTIDIPDWNPTDSGLILTLDGNVLWGSFDFGGFFRGILRIDERPFRSSYETLPFNWRGEDDSAGYSRDGDEEPDGSFVRFLGDGHIEGEIGCGDGFLKFYGDRISGQDTRSEISAWSMRRQWQEGPDLDYRL